MLKKLAKIKIFIICFTVAILSLQMLSVIYAESNPKDEITHTAKIIFSESETGNLSALIIRYTSEGYRPRSGWITCDIIDPDIVKIYSEKLKNQEKIEGYFTATYKKIEKDKSTPILRYKGELLKIEPWDPPFIKDSK